MNSFFIKSVLVFVIALSAAYCVDIRMKGLGLIDNLESFDSTMQLHEAKAILQVKMLGVDTPALKKMLDQYHAAPTRQERRQRFAELIAALPQSAITQADRNNIMIRRSLDEYTGALNRRGLVEKSYDDTVIEYNHRLSSFSKKFAGLPKHVD